MVRLAKIAIHFPRRRVSTTPIRFIFKRANQPMLLFPQNTGQNQPLRTFQFWQDLDQQFAEEICCNDVDPSLEISIAGHPRLGNRPCSILFRRAFSSPSRLRSDRDRSQLSRFASSVPPPMPEFLDPVPRSSSAKIPCLACAPRVPHCAPRTTPSESSSPAFATTSPSPCARPSQTPLPRESRASSSFSLARGGRDDNQPFPYLQRLGFAHAKISAANCAAISRLFRQIASESSPAPEQFGLGNFRDRIPYVPVWETIASRQPRNFMQCHFVGSEPARAGPLSPNEHQPNTRKLFLLPFLRLSASPLFFALTRRHTSY